MKPDALVFVLACVVVFAIVLLAYSRYMVKTDLEVRILNQTSSCYSGQPQLSEAKWRGGGIVMTTAFEIPDPCYKIESIKAFQKGNRIEVAIKTASGGICIQCFGFRETKYEILSPVKEGDLDIYVDVDGVRQYAWLPFSA